jgi:hypothetical protein
VLGVNQHYGARVDEPPRTYRRHRVHRGHYRGKKARSARYSRRYR